VKSGLDILQIGSELMTVRERLMAEIGDLPNGLVVQALALIQFLKVDYLRRQTALASGGFYRPRSGRSPLRHAGKWAGDDLLDCLDLIRSNRGIF
jgi:hypothetical protein